MQLYSYWRSLAAFRVRIALNLKGMPYDVKTVDLIKGDQFRPEYTAINPQSVVPALVDGKTTLYQSMAILEYLEETHPTPPLLPKAPLERARVRGLALILAADTHPLMVPRIRAYITKDMGHSQEELLTWIRHWSAKGLQAVEEHLASEKETGKYCHGDSPTMADVCLMPQCVGSGLFGVDIAQFPTVKRVFDTCMATPAFERAHPRHQPDFEPAGH
ncbi:MAG: maleylacetoacetate isomerase [Alphaproteobacteria bacterium]